MALAMLACCLAGGPGSALAQEKERTAAPPSPGFPMAEGWKMLDVGALAPEFSLKDAEGAPFHFAEHRGKKPVLLVFWSMFCEPCRFEMPIVQKMHNRYRDAGLEVVAVSLDGEPLRRSVLGFARQEGYTFRVLIDEVDSGETFKAADPYGVAGTPTLYLVDRAGKIALSRAGRMKEEELEKAVQAVLKR